MLHELRYKLEESGIEVMEGCSTNHLIQEIKQAVSEAFREITVTIDHSPEWGICRIIAVNGREIVED